MHRHELTDQEGELLTPLIPRAGTGRPRVDDRRILNGMVSKIRTGIAWRDLPERYGPWKTVYPRFRRCALRGVFARVLQQLRARADAAGNVDRLVQTDSTSVRAHQHAAATGQTAAQPRQKEQDDHALGRSRGGLTTKVHLIADRAYSSQGFRAYLRRRGIAHTIPERFDQKGPRRRRGSVGGLPPSFDQKVCRCRNTVERCFDLLKGFRGIAIRYDKTTTSYEAAVCLASCLLWARSL
ncbi:IS5 family transposase [Streptomyces viridosporus]|uniref:IS5 family transposase n=1 Tax=Streptomyces viridosporus TaxID=67581 RepID=UPI0007C508D6|nr:IS5 family transposase [Streptomyces viridosporus]